MIKNDSPKIALLPNSPGVYMWKAGSEVIYVGKARVLKDRARSYFHRSTEDPKVCAIVSRATDIEWILTDSEVEALVLENTLIKKYKPRYNIDLKENRRYPYLRVAVKEIFPKIEIVRKKERDGARYFGPFVNVSKMRSVVDMVESVFHLRTCNTVIKSVDTSKRPCLNYQIGKCAGVCAGLVSIEEYKTNINRALLFLSGKSAILIKELEAAMNSYAANLDFERAAAIRDNIDMLRRVFNRQRMDSSDITDRDILAVAVGSSDSCVAVFTVRDGAVTGRHHHYLKLSGGESSGEVIQSFIENYYQSGVDFPKEIMVSASIPDHETVENWLATEAGHSVRIIQPLKGEKAKLMDLCVRNSEMLLHELLSSRDAAGEKVHVSVGALQKELRLSFIPNRIEAYDISHIQGSDTVASRVVFVNAKPRKSLYRHYIIESVSGVDDFASMREVLDRRLRAALENKDPMPDLMLIDGGKGQLSAVVERLQKAGLYSQPVISLAKKLEEVFVPDKSEPVMIPRKSPALFLLQRLRDEAHRFAVSFHRKKREERAVSSVLDTIPGVGSKRRKLLLEKFGSVEAIAALQMEDLVSAGINKKSAEIILSHITNRQ